CHRRAVSLKEEERSVLAIRPVGKLKTEEAVGLHWRIGRHCAPREDDVSCSGRARHRDSEVSDHEPVSDVRIGDFFSMRHLQDLGASPTESIHEWSIGVGADAIQVPVVEQRLESSIDAVAAVVLEETKNLTS